MKTWKASKDIIHTFQAVGRASLLYDIQDSHSGNMVIGLKDEKGEKRIAITATGSQKGDLDPDHICLLSDSETDFGYYKASSETDIHARILSLDGADASMHCHTKELTIAAFDDTEALSKLSPFIPVDPLGHYHLGGRIPIDWFEVPVGSPEMAERIPMSLAQYPVTLVQTHGAFSRGRTLLEAFFYLCVANNSGRVVRLLSRQEVGLEELREKIQSDPDSCFSYQPTAYTIDDNHTCDFPNDENMVTEFVKTGARIFESRLSPFHTGSFSIRGVKTIRYAPKASMPRELGGPLLEIPIHQEKSDDQELGMHKAIYEETTFQSVMHCYIPEAEAHSYYTYPGETDYIERIIPIDAEGSFLYLVIPVLPAKFETETFIKLLHDYKVVVVRGGGVWAVGDQSLSEVLHHPSSVREICLYRIGAVERGLNLRKMEPQKAHRW
jgi:L-fuculose-phosphate aldolase